MIAELIEKWVNRDKIRVLRAKNIELQNLVEYWKQLCQKRILEKVENLQDLIVGEARERRSKYRIDMEEQKAKDFEIMKVELEKYKKLYDDAIKPEPKLKHFEIIFKDRVMEVIEAYRYEERMGNHFFYDGFGNEIAMFKDVAGIKIKEI